MTSLKGKKVMAYGKSVHAGQIGLVVEDWGNYLLVKPDNQDYAKAHKNSGREGKYCQFDSRLAKEVKDK